MNLNTVREVIDATDIHRLAVRRAAKEIKGDPGLKATLHEVADGLNISMTKLQVLLEESK